MRFKARPAKSATPSLCGPGQFSSVHLAEPCSPLQGVLLPSCGECDQQATSGCQPLQGLLQLERTPLPKLYPSQGGLHLVSK